jgi:hypothetical protein
LLYSRFTGFEVALETTNDSAVYRMGAGKACGFSLPSLRVSENYEVPANICHFCVFLSVCLITAFEVYLKGSHAMPTHTRTGTAYGMFLVRLVREKSEIAANFVVFCFLQIFKLLSLLPRSGARADFKVCLKNWKPTPPHHMAAGKAFGLSFVGPGVQREFELAFNLLFFCLLPFGRLTEFEVALEEVPRSLHNIGAGKAFGSIDFILPGRVLAIGHVDFEVAFYFFLFFLVLLTGFQVVFESSHPATHNFMAAAAFGSILFNPRPLPGGGLVMVSVEFEVAFHFFLFCLVLLTGFQVSFESSYLATHNTMAAAAFGTLPFRWILE